MPQLYQLALVYQSQWFWLLLVLGAIYFFVGRGIVPKVEATVDERDARISADLAEAQRLQDEAEISEQAWREKMNAGHAEAQEVMVKAKAKAAQNVEKAVAKANAEIAGKLTEAEAALAQARDAALAELESVAAEAAQDIVVKLAGAKVTDAAAKKAVAGVLANA